MDPKSTDRQIDTVQRNYYKLNFTHCYDLCTLLTLLLLYGRVPPVSVVPLAQWELREPLVSLVAPVLLVPLDPR